MDAGANDLMMRNLADQIQKHDWNIEHYGHDKTSGRIGMLCAILLTALALFAYQLLFNVETFTLPSQIVKPINIGMKILIALFLLNILRRIPTLIGEKNPKTSKFMTYKQLIEEEKLLKEQDKKQLVELKQQAAKYAKDCEASAKRAAKKAAETASTNDPDLSIPFDELIRK